jgi:uncharacterized protein
VQSCYAACFPSSYQYPLRWQQYELVDGDFIEIAWLGDRSKPLAILLPGLSGSYKSWYMASLANILVKDFCVLLLHQRACGLKINLMARSYHAAYTQDLAEYMQYLGRHYPGRTMVAVGFSVGANILLQYCRQHDDFSKIACISPPYDLAACVNKMPQFYQRRILSSMRHTMALKMSSGHQLPITMGELKSISTIREFDAKITAPMFNFSSVDDYYHRSSCKVVSGPALLLNSSDDPFVDIKSLPDAADMGPNASLYLTEFGGHVGFISGGAPWSARSIMGPLVYEYLTDN